MKLKKLLAAVTTGVLAVTSLSLSGLVSSAEVQELMNDTFESGYGAWKGVGSSLSLSTEQSHSGGTSLYCYDRTASWGAPRSSLTGIVAAGQSYEISASAMYEGSGQQNMAIKMIYTDANGNCILTKRSGKKMISCFIGLFKMWRFIDKNYDAAKETYAKRYTELTSMNFWRKYLEL